MNKEFSKVELELMAYCMRTVKFLEAGANEKPTWYLERMEVFSNILDKIKDLQEAQS